MLATLRFLADLSTFESEKPYQLFGFPEIPPSERTNCEFGDQDNIQLHDLRSHVEEVSIKNHGFTFINHVSSCNLKAECFEDATRDNAIVDTYLKECIDFFQTIMKAERVFCIDWRLRRNSPSQKSVNEADPRYCAIPPARVIHSDFSREDGRERLEMHLSSIDIRQILSSGRRVQFFNVWRPFRLVTNAPLVLCDRRTVHTNDLLEADKVFESKVDRDYFVRYREDQKWYWLSDQRPDEVTLFKSWDSAGEGDVADFPPHGSATIPFDKEIFLPRESVEVRLIALFNGD